MTLLAPALSDHGHSGSLRKGRPRKSRGERFTRGWGGHYQPARDHRRVGQTYGKAAARRNSVV